MLTLDQFGYVSIQAVTFLAAAEDFSQSKFLGSVLSTFADRYDGEVQTLPLGKDIPSEVAIQVPLGIPRVTLSSQDKHWKMRAGPARIDSLWDGGELVEDVGVQLDSCWEVLKQYMRSGASVNRLGFVVQRALICDEPAQALVRHFFSSEDHAMLFARSADFEIHSHTVETLPGWETRVNFWNRCQTGLLTEDDRSIIVFKQDINTLPSSDAHFDVDEIDTFYGRAFARMGEAALDYFPGGYEK